MIDTIDDVEPPHRSGDSDRTQRAIGWPSAEEAVKRIEERVSFAGDAGSLGHIDPLDLIVIMREIGRLTAEAKLRSQPRVDIYQRLEELEAYNTRLQAALASARDFIADLRGVHAELPPPSVLSAMIEEISKAIRT